MNQDKQLTVILGAGASASINTVHSALDRQEYRPPVADDIFQNTNKFRSILRRFNLAEDLASDIDVRLRRNIKGQGLEQILRSYVDSIVNNGNSHIARQYTHIPLYLNELFGEISQFFTSQPSEYMNLVREIMKRNISVLFLSLNYDNLLEIPLSRSFGLDFSRFEDYISGDNWKLVKLHGSVNWHKKIISEDKVSSEELYFKQLTNIKLPLKLASDFTFTNANQHELRFRNDGSIYYPVITVPTEGKYDLNCPIEHLDAAYTFLKECKNYLIIGNSGRDQDLLGVLKKYSLGEKVKIVGKSEKGTLESKRRFIKGVPQFSNNFSAYFKDKGFTDFIDGGYLENYLDLLI